MHLPLVITLSLLIPRAHTTEAVVTSRPASTTSSNVREVSPPTCPFRTINYITHTLPQQCLRTSRESNGTTSSSNSQFSTGSGGPEKELTITQAQENESQSAPAISSIGTNDPPTTTVTVSLSVPSSEPIPDDPLTTISSQPPDSDTKISPEHESAEVDVDLDSSLDNSNFLSFEEWKKQNLAKAGQSSENIGNRRTGDMGAEVRRRPGGINNALESLGDDGEIDLDFGDFVSPSGAHHDRDSASSWRDQVSDHVQAQDGANGDKTEAERPSSQRTNGKGAGTTYTERFNYASFDCAATILKTSSESKGSSSILVENKDSYMLTACSVTNKFLIVELCNDILVDTVVLANYEFFSSMFRSFRISVSGTYPAKPDRWKELGTFEARNTREVQPFKIDNPLIWARYLRVEFLTHFGNEYYCPVSLLRVHGTTMMEEFKNQGDAARADDEIDEQELEPNKDHPEETVQASSSATETETAALETDQKLSPPDRPTVEVEAHAKDEIGRGLLEDTSNIKERSEKAKETGDLITMYSFSAQHQLETILFSGLSSSLPVCSRANSAHQNETSASYTTTLDADSSTHSGEPETLASESSELAQESTIASESKASTTPDGQNSTTTERKSSTDPSTTVSNSQKGASQNASDFHRSIPSATSPSPANPTTQESFFKTIHKRLQLLEANSSLSLQYIEEQSRILRDAFVKVEKKQTSKAASFLEQLNSTVLTELRGFRVQYDQIWQSTVLELESQRERADRELLAVSSRLTLLADEIIFQKRLSIVQSLLLLLCLGFVMFSRSGAATSSYLELPLIQNVLSRSQSTLRMPFESPLGSPSSSRPNSSRYDHRPPSFPKHHRRQRSDSSYDGTNANQSGDGPQSPTIGFSPPTPTLSHTGQSETSPERQTSQERQSSMQSDHSASQSPDERLELPEMPTMKTQSSPATPSGTRGPRKHPLSWHDRDYVGSDLLQPEHAKDRTSGTNRKSPLNEDSGLGLPINDNEEEGGNRQYEVQEYVDDGKGQSPTRKAFPTPPPENGRTY